MGKRTLGTILDEMLVLLERHGAEDQALTVRRLRDVEDPFDFGEMAQSLEVWGGVGSVIDVNLGSSRDNRRFNELIVDFEEALDQLGLSSPRSAQVARTIEDWLNTHPPEE